MRALEQKWQKAWEEAKLFEVDADPNKPKKFITAAFPYPNSPQHVGHGRTYTIADVYARYWRMRGYNVLFPMGFHVTGTPIFAMAKRLKQGDEELYDIFERIYGIGREEAQRLTDPVELVTYFSHEIEQGMKEMGYSIDWRRKFYTYDKTFNAFIQWQFRRLKDKGYIFKGKQPVTWCPSCKNVLSSHDTKGDKDPEIEAITLLFFKAGDVWVPVATYRPETVYGVTNLWFNPDVKYVRVRDERGKVFVMSEDAYAFLRYQWALELEGEAQVPDVVENVFTGERVPVIAARFVKSDKGTGIVMSVPAHAPFDYVALKEVQRNGLFKHLQLKSLIEVEGERALAQRVVEERGIESQDDERLETLTKQVYAKELKHGVFIVQPYAGKRVEEVRDLVKADAIKRGVGKEVYELANAPIYCRCGAKAVVKMFDEQWFIDYGNEEWKQAARRLLDDMVIVPDKMKALFYQVIDWLKAKPCTRNRGLGTPFPFDTTQIIEPLSDSTIYPAFYTIAHLLDKPLSDEAFDYIFLGKGEGNEVLDAMRKEFVYWYGVDSRHSATELIWNHLTFYIFNHVALFPPQFWPKQIVVNGVVLMEGQKMSKSLGNILPLRKAIRQYGADTIRVTLMGGAELGGDTDFSDSVAKGIRQRLEFFLSLRSFVEEEREPEDFYLLARLHSYLKDLTQEYEQFEFRRIVNKLFYELYQDVVWYLKRVDKPRMLRFLKDFARAIAPLAPHVAEELWHATGENTFVSTERIDVYDASLVDQRLMEEEELIKAVYHDVNKIVQMVGKGERVEVLLPAQWKYEVYDMMRAGKRLDEIVAVFDDKKAVAQFVQRYRKVRTLPQVLDRERAKSVLERARKFFEKEFKMTFVVKDEDGRKYATPDKFGIVIA